LRLSFSGALDLQAHAALKRLGCLATELWNELQARRLKDSKKDAVDQDSTVQRIAVAALCSSD
jgi:hypothetical protein